MLNLGNEQTITLSKSNMQKYFSRVSSEENLESKSFKLIKGMNGPTTFLPLSPKVGGQVNNDRPSIGQYLTREQANFVYKKAELGDMINIDTWQQDMEHKRQLNKIDDTNRETNPIQRIDCKQLREPLMA